MKLFKKLTAVVAMAAVCLSMAAPVSANAAGCEHLSLRKITGYEVLDNSAHKIFYVTDVDGDDIEDTVFTTCYKEKRKYYTRYICMHCKQILQDIYETTIIVHLHKKCADYVEY